MSNTMLIRSSIKGAVDIEILKKALEVIAEEEGIKVGDSTEDYYGHKVTSHQGLNIIGSLAPSELSRGIGVAVDKDGKLHFVGDDYQHKSAFKKMEQRIEQTYQDIVLILAVQQLGFEADVEKTKGMLRIEGSRGG